MTPPMLTRQSGDEPEKDQGQDHGQWTTIVRKKQRGKGTTTRQARTEGANHNANSNSKAAEMRQLIRAMEHTLQTGKNLKPMSTRQQAVYGQTLQQLKANASRDYQEVGKLATRLYGTAIQRTRDRHHYNRELLDYVQSFPTQAGPTGRHHNKEKESDRARAYGTRRPGVEETKEIEPEDTKGEEPAITTEPETPEPAQRNEKEITTPKMSGNVHVHPRDGASAHITVEDDNEEQMSTGDDDTAYTMDSHSTERTAMDNKQSSEDREQQTGQDGSTLDYDSQHSATTRIRASFEAAAKTLDGALAMSTEEEENTTKMTDPQQQRPRNKVELEHEETARAATQYQDNDIMTMAMDVTFLQDKVRQRGEEIQDLKTRINQLLEMQALSQRHIEELQKQLEDQTTAIKNIVHPECVHCRRHIEELQKQLEDQTTAIKNMQQAQEHQKGSISTLDVEQAVLHNEMAALEARIGIMATHHQEVEEHMLRKSDIPHLVRTQLQEQARKVARIIYTTTRDQCQEACEAIHQEQLTRLRQDGDMLHNGLLTKMQRAGDEVHNAISEANEDVQEKNIQMLDAAVATYESEISTARTAEITHFRKEIQQMTLQHKLPELRQRVAQVQQAKTTMMMQVQQQLADTQTRLTKDMHEQVLTIIRNHNSGHEQVARKDLEDLRANNRREIEHQLEELRTEMATDQRLNSMRKDIEDQVMETISQRLNALRSWAVGEHDRIGKLIREEITTRDPTLGASISQEQQDRLNQWQEDTRREIKDHVQHFQQEVETLREAVTRTQQQTARGPNQQDQQEQVNQVRRELETLRADLSRQRYPETTSLGTQHEEQWDQPSQPMFRGHPIDLSGTQRTATTATTGPTPGMRTEHHQSYKEHMAPDNVDRAQQLANRSIMKDTQKFKREEMVWDLPMTDTLPPQRTMEGNYKMLHNAAVAYGFPLLPFRELEAHSHTTMPPDAPQTHDDETLQLVSTTIYLKLNVIIPPINEQLRVFLRQQADNQDGYQALFNLMQHTCDHLRLIRHPWGPDWTSDRTIHEYYSSLQSKIQNENRQGRKYTPLEVAAEFLQQAMKQSMYVMTASQMLTELRGVALRRLPLPSHLEVGNILATYQNITTLISPSPGQQPTTMGSIHKVRFHTADEDQPTIHAMKRQEGERPNNTRPANQKTRNPVQCPACNKFGHSVDHQICHFAAQTVKAQEWIKDNPADAQTNAQAYQLSNAPRTVKQMELQFQELFTDTMTEDDKQDLRDRMVSTFTHGHQTSDGSPQL